MAIFPVVGSDVKNYMNEDKKKSIEGKVGAFYGEEHLNVVEICQVLFEGRDLNVGEDGYINCSVSVLGRYYPKKREISLNEEDLASKVNYLRQKLMKNQYRLELAYLLCDLILIHELVHAYQDQVEGRKMEKGSAALEDDANLKTEQIFEEKYDCSGAEKKLILDFFKDNLGRKEQYRLSA